MKKYILSFELDKKGYVKNIKMLLDPQPEKIGLFERIVRKTIDNKAAKNVTDDIIKLK